MSYEYRVCHVCGKTHYDNQFKCSYCRQKSARIKSPESFIQWWWTFARKGAKARNIPWDLTENDFKNLAEAKYCALSGLRLVREPKHPDIPSLDRIDSDRGYTLDNVQVVSSRVNIAKNKQSDSDFVEMCQAVANTRGRKSDTLNRFYGELK
jgi:hypothetical protein